MIMMILMMMLMMTMMFLRYCGTELRCLSAAPTTAVTGTAGQTVCSMNKPFKVSFSYR